MSIAQRYRALINQIGQAVTFRRPPSSADYDPVSGTVSGGDTEFKIAAVIKPLKAEEIVGPVLQDDLLAVIAAAGLPLVPQLGDMLLIDGAAHRVEEVKVDRARGQVVRYRLRIRG